MVRNDSRSMAIEHGGGLPHQFPLSPPRMTSIPHSIRFSAIETRLIDDLIDTPLTKGAFRRILAIPVERVHGRQKGFRQVLPSHRSECRPFHMGQGREILICDKVGFILLKETVVRPYARNCRKRKKRSESREVFGGFRGDAILDREMSIVALVETS